MLYVVGVKEDVVGSGEEVLSLQDGSYVKVEGA